MVAWEATLKKPFPVLGKNHCWSKEMHHVEQMNIILVVEDEKSLYTNFSPEAEFDHDVKEYIKSKIAGEEDNKSVQLTVVSQDPLDEEKFRSAVSNWISDEKKVLRQSEKNTTRLFFGLLVFGSIMILLSSVLVSRFTVLQNTLIPIMGSVSLTRAVRTLIIDVPKVRAQKWIFKEMEKNNVVSFEYDN